MWFQDRHKTILALLQARRQLSSEVLAQELGVSRETVRRDLIELEQSGQLSRVHGGAIAGPAVPEASYLERVRSHRAEKRAMARCALALLEPGMCCFMDAGSTTHALAQEMVQVDRLQVITNSIEAAMALAANASIEVLLLGGRFASELPATYGEQTVGEIRRFRADLALVSPVAVHPEHGVMDYAWHEAGVAQAMLAQAERRVLLAHAEKLGATSRTQICPVSQIDVLVTDAAADAGMLQRLHAAGVREVRGGALS